MIKVTVSVKLIAPGPLILCTLLTRPLIVVVVLVTVILSDPATAKRIVSSSLVRSTSILVSPSASTTLSKLVMLEKILVF